MGFRLFSRWRHPLNHKEKSNTPLGVDAFIEDGIAALQEGRRDHLLVAYGAFALNDAAQMRRAAQAIHLTLSALSPEALMALEESIRGTGGAHWDGAGRGFWDIDWNRLDIRRIQGLLCGPEEAFWFLAAGTLHGNGHLRERCVSALGEEDPRALPFVLIRMNDWVEPVRREAAKSAENLLSRCHLENLLELLPYWAKLKRCQRREESKLLALYEDYRTQLLQLGGIACADQMQRFHRDARRLYYEILLTSEEILPAQMMTLFRREPDPFTRKMSVKQLLRKYPGNRDLMRECLQSSNDEIRLLALEMAYASAQGLWEGIEEWLLDESRRVREYVRFLLAKELAFDFATFYEARLEGGNCISAVYGLGEIRDLQGGSLLMELIGTENFTLAKALVTSIGKICGRKEAELYLYFLQDERSGVSKAAFRVIQSLGLLYGGKTLYEAYLDTTLPFVRRRLCALLAHERAWDRLPYLIWLWTDQDPVIQQRVVRSLYHWSAGFIAPSEEERERLQKALAENGDKLPEEIRWRIDYLNSIF